MTMTSEAKHALAATIRSLRTRLLADLHDATESAYRLALAARDAGLDEAARARRGRAAAWLDEQVRAQGSAGAKGDRTAADFRREAEKQAAYTLLNRLVLLRLMEAPGPSGAPLREIPVVTGGWESHGYQTFRQLAPGIARGDETEGSTGPTCPRTWSATAGRTWRSTARPGGCATPAAGTPRASSPSTSPPGS